MVACDHFQELGELGIPSIYTMRHGVWDWDIRVSYYMIGVLVYGKA